MGLLKGFADHAWRVMTLRHRGEGLPTGGPALIACVALAIFSGVIRHEAYAMMAVESAAQGLSLASFLINFSIALVLLRIGMGAKALCAYAILSVALDMLSLPLLSFDAARTAFMIWEGLGLLVIIVAIRRDTTQEA